MADAALGNAKVTSEGATRGTSPGTSQGAPGAVVLGLGTNGLAVVRALGRAGVPVTVLMGRGDSAEVYARTRYGTQVEAHWEDGEGLVRRLNALDPARRHVVFPTTDKAVEQLSAARAGLAPHLAVALPEASVVDTLMDKIRFEAFAAAHGFPIPRSAFVTSEAEAAAAASSLKFPVIMKTRVKVYKDGLDKAYIVESPDSLMALYRKLSPLHPDYLLQEFIPGTDADVYFCMQYVGRDGKVRGSFAGRKLRQWKPLQGGTTCAEPVDEPAMEELTSRIFAAAGFIGVGSMEYKKDPRDGRFYCIEPTVGRTDFQEGVAIANGMNIPLLAFRDLAGLPPVDMRRVPGPGKAWMHLDNDRKARDWLIKEGKLTYRGWLASLRRVRSFDYLSLSDPGPALDAARRRVMSLPGAVLRRLRR